MNELIVFIVYTISLSFPDSARATVYYPQLFQDPQMYVVSGQCTRLDAFTLDCWQMTGGTVELKIRASCRTDPIQIGFRERSETHGQLWRDVTIANPAPCKTTPARFGFRTHLPVVIEDARPQKRFFADE